MKSEMGNMSEKLGAREIPLRRMEVSFQRNEAKFNNSLSQANFNNVLTKGISNFMAF